MEIKAIEQRIFVESNEGYKLISLCGLDFFDGQFEIDSSDKDIPPELDTIFPQNIFLVFQDSEHDEDFFDKSKPGLMLEVKGFRLIWEEQPFIIMVNKDTGEVSIPNPKFRIEYYYIHEYYGSE